MQLIYKCERLPDARLILLKSEIKKNRANIEKRPDYLTWAQKSNSDRIITKNKDEVIFSNVFLRHIIKNGGTWYDEIRSEDNPELLNFPELKKFLTEFAIKKKSIVGRINLTFLSSKDVLKLHVDDGDFYALHDRYHIAIQTTGTTIVCGDKKELFQDGDIFYLNNKEIHTGYIEDDSIERIHVIFDLLPHRLTSLIGLYLKWFYYATKYPLLHKKTLRERIAMFKKVLIAYKFALEENLKLAKSPF